MRIGRNQQSISHLMFTDGLLLFGEALTFHINIVLECLDKFCWIYEQKINHNKTSIFFLRNVKHEMKELIFERSGFATILDLRMYLGLPLINKRVTKHIFNHILKKFRINQWVRRQSVYRQRGEKCLLNQCQELCQFILCKW